ncbi:hypothetical protein ACHHYP_16197 [Achlya hypogyna]|uniref:START domain-containing protein n=1 Tax=Achlya hypogyna TaxID=1202772 RepID=A0A1V9Y9F7_ACHHY|nr:hypothetical protein ACHHYP_16197 [Achlya hypogyna]
MGEPAAKDVLEIIFDDASSSATDAYSGHTDARACTDEAVQPEDLAAFLNETLAFRAPNRKRRMQEPKEEIAYLKAKREVLLQQLEELQDARVAVEPESWKARASQQAQLTARCMQENIRLKGLVQDQLQVIQALERVLEKRPRLVVFPAHDALRGVLGACSRLETLELLLQHQHDRIDSDCIRHGLHDAQAENSNVRKAFVHTTDEGNVVQLSVINCMLMEFNFVGTADLVWADKTRPKPNMTVLAEFHDDLVYVRQCTSYVDSSTPVLEAHIAVRRYVKADRIDVVWRSVLEDTLQPHDTAHWVDNRAGWISVHFRDGNQSYLQGFVTQTTPSVPAAELFPSVGAFTEHFLQTWQSNLQQAWQKLEVKSSRAWLSAMHEHPSAMAHFLNCTSDFSCGATLDPPSPRRGKRRNREPKAELEYLRAKHEALTEQLTALQALQPVEVTPWQSRAISQARQVQRSLQENAQLKEEVADQLELIQMLERALQRLPKLSDFPVNGILWMQAVLGRDRRCAAAEALMARQYERLEGEWIRLGLFAAYERNELLHKSYIESNDDRLQFNFVHCVAMATDYETMADILWTDKTTGKVQTTADAKLPAPSDAKLGSRLILRRYIEKDRIVLLWRSILHDELYPHADGQLIDNRCGWVVVYPKGPHTCYIQGYVTQMTPSLPAAGAGPAVGTLTELFLQVWDQALKKNMEKKWMQMNDIGGMEILAMFQDDAFGDGALVDDAVSVEHISAFLATTTDFGDLETFDVADAPVTPPRAASSPATSQDRASASSPDDSDETSQPAAPKKRLRERPKQELEYLRSKHTALEQQLRTLQAAQRMTTTLSEPWQARAIDQAQAAQRALQENSRLKGLVEDQIKVVHALERILTKRPRLSAIGSNDGLWKQAILSFDDHAADLEQLMAYQRGRLESEWIRHKIHDATERGETIKRVLLEGSPGDRHMGLGYVAVMTMPLDFRSMADIMWEHKTGMLGATCKIVHTYHNDLVYTREDVVLPDARMPVLESRDGIRRYIEADRVVILWRSIVEDQYRPHVAGHLVCNRWGWMVLQAKSATECYLQGCVTTATPIFPAGVDAIEPAVGTWTELLLCASQEHKHKFGDTMHAALDKQRKLRGRMETVELDILDAVFDNDTSMGDVHLSAFLSATTDFCAPLSPSPPTSGSETGDTAPAASKKRRQCDRPKAELEYLRTKHNELVLQLKQLQASSIQSRSRNETPWKTRAHGQMHLVQRCLQENARLKDQVADQIKVIHTLERILRKRPRSSAVTNACGLPRQLSLGMTSREDDMERIVKHHYDRLESEFIRHGLHDAVEKNEPMQKLYMHDGDVGATALNFAACMVRPLDYRGMADVFWDLKTGRSDPNLQIIEALHPHLIYSREALRLVDPNMPVMETRHILRRYEEHNRVVVVWCSVVEDALKPHEPGNLIGSQAGWVVMQAKSATECHLLIAASLSVPVFPATVANMPPAIGTWSELLLQSSTKTKERFGADLDRATEARKKLLALA